MTTVLKLGGSVITDKNSDETIDEDALAKATIAIASADTSDLVLVHGGGSFGHPTARDHGISMTAGSTDPVAIRNVHDAMKRLNTIVIDSLADRGVTALPVHPLSTAYRDEDRTFTMMTEQIRTMKNEGFVPVIHGDVIVQEGVGATVVSGDELLVTLARDLRASRVGLCSTVPGVLDEHGDIIPSISDYESVAGVLGASESTDVTGGMEHKVRTLLSLSTSATIFGVDDLSAFFSGQTPGTRIAKSE